MPRHLSNLSIGVVVLSTLVAASAGAAEETKKPALVVMDLVAERGIDTGITRLLNEFLLTQFAQGTDYAVIGGSDIQAIMSNETQKQVLSGCADIACLAELGGALGADFLAVSSIGRIGDYYLLNVKILNVKTAQVVRRWSEQVEGLENKLMAAVSKSVAAVAGEHALVNRQIYASPVGGAHVSTTGSGAPAGSLGMPGIAPIALWGTGGAGVLLGVIFGIKANGHADKANDPTYVGAQQEIAPGETAKLLANVSYGLGATALVAGLVVWLFVPTGSGSAPSVALGPGPTPSGVSVAVTF